MLCDALAGSYRRYKEDTDTFTTWLLQSSKRCGWKPVTRPEAVPMEACTSAAPKAPRLKGRERKLARNAVKSEMEAEAGATPTVKYTITAKDLLEQAAAVTAWNREKIRMPSDVRRVLERAIRARKRCACWFERSDSHNKLSNAGHQSFIGVLQEVADMLEGEDERSTSPNLQQPNASTDEEVQARNHFSSLTVEDLKEDNEDHIPTPSSSDLFVLTPSVTARGKTATRVIYELAADPQSDLAFKVFCFFEDLHALQSELGRMWKAYHSGNLDLLSATLVTTAAIDLVHRTEKEIHIAHPGVFKPSQSYQDLALMIFYSESLREGKDPDQIIDSPDSVDLEITPFKEFMYLPTGRTLMKIAQMRHVFKKGAYPVPMAPMRFNYIVRPDLLEPLRMRKFEAEDELIGQFILDLTLLEDVRTFGTIDGIHKNWKLMPPFDDAFTEAMRKVWKNGDVSVASVFAARILLDIVEICGPDFSGQRLLSDKAECAKSLLFTDDRDVLDTEDGVRFLPKEVELIDEIHNRIALHMFMPPFGSFKERMLAQHSEDPDDEQPSLEDLERMDPKRVLRVPVEPSLRKRNHSKNAIPAAKSKQYHDNAKKLNITSIRPNSDPNFLINRNPLYCGTVLLNLAAMTEEIGIAGANHLLSITATAHLYNALRQMNLRQAPWPEMDRIIRLHVGSIFANDIPSTPEAIYSRICYRFGLTGSAKIFNKKQPWKLHTTHITRTLMQFFASKEPLEKMLCQLEDQIHDKEQAQVAKSSLASQPNTHRKTVARRQLTPLQFIAELEKYIPSVLPDVTIDYVTLTRTCNMLLKSIRLALKSKLRVSYPSVQTSGDSNDHRMRLMMVAWILHDNNDAAKSARKGAPFAGGPQLRVANETFEAFFRRG